jgi:hypothetical protein
MMNGKSTLIAAAVSLMSAAGMAPSSAELPMIHEKEWLGYFMGMENNNFKFGMTPDGKAVIDVLSKKGDRLASTYRIAVDFQVEQTMPDGKVSRLAILPETLESAQPPAADAKQTIVRGKVKGDASFEVTMEKSRNGLLVGGRLVDPGTLPADSLRFSIGVKFPNIYDKEMKAMKAGDKKAAKDHEEKLEEDRIQLTLADRKKVKLSSTESVDASSKEFNGPGIMATEISLSPYQGKNFELAASPNSTMTFSNTKAGPLHEGFTVIWTADPAKDPKGAARMSIGMK